MTPTTSVLARAQRDKGLARADESAADKAAPPPSASDTLAAVRRADRDAKAGARKAGGKRSAASKTKGSRKSSQKGRRAQRR